MIATYISPPASPADRGHRFGTHLRDQVRHTVETYMRLFEVIPRIPRDQIGSLGAKAAAWLRARHPALADEIQAIAEGADVSPDLLFAINARTELLSGTASPECTVVGVTPTISAGGHVLLAQNWDWHPDAADSRIVWHVQAGDGAWFTTFTEAGLIGKIGLSSHGLGVALNILGTTRDGGVGGLPVHVACRLLLEDCTNLSTAVHLLMNSPFAASTCFNLGYADDHGGSLASVEVSPGGAQYLAPSDGRLLHTNHFLNGPLGATDSYIREWPDTLTRLGHVAELAQALTPPVRLHDLGELLKSHHGGKTAVCAHDFENPEYARRQGTLASVQIDVTGRMLWVSDGPPCVNALYDPFAAEAGIPAERAS
jgi:isopenicillin-N N-acyltransferase-like protein